MPDNTELLTDLIALAARSPSAHNTQPWAPRIVKNTVEVAVVPSRTLPAGDPTFRDVVLALGAWVESFTIGAADAGRGVRVEVLPAIADLDHLPVTGAADPSHPVLRLRLVGRPRKTVFAPDDVRQRAVYRGGLAGDTSVFANLNDARLPAWLSVREIDPAVMGHLSRLGIAYTASRHAVAVELLHWLRLSHRHPQYQRDGLTDVALLMPRWLAALATPVTKRARVRELALNVRGVFGRIAEGYYKAKPLPPLGTRVRGHAALGTHYVLVANAREAGMTDVLSSTEAMDSRIGIPEPLVIDAGRALQRLWLHAHRAGVAVSPHSELIDSPLAHGALRRRLGLARADVALAVFSAGRPLGEVPRSSRLPIAPAVVEQCPEEAARGGRAVP